MDESFAAQLERFIHNRCPECGAQSAAFRTKAWPYCKKHGNVAPDTITPTAKDTKDVVTDQ